MQIPERLASSSIDRDTVVEWAEGVRVGDHGAQRDAFVVSMIWGYGPVPYGPFRTRRILQRPEFVDELADVTRVAIEQGGIEAYQHVYERRWKDVDRYPSFLKWLGPAFGTKYLYFLSRAHHPDAITPVLDAVVRRWFAVNAPDVDVHIGYQWGYPRKYATFVETVTDWGSQLGIRADEVEYLIFAAQQAADGGSGHGTWLAPAIPIQPDQLLEQLGLLFGARGRSDEAAGPLNELRDLLDSLEEAEAEA